MLDPIPDAVTVLTWLATAAPQVYALFQKDHPKVDFSPIVKPADDTDADRDAAIKATEG